MHGGGHAPQPYLNGGGRMDMGRGVASEFRGGGGGGEYAGGGGVSMNGHGRGGYPAAVPSGGARGGRSADRERDRERWVYGGISLLLAECTKVKGRHVSYDRVEPVVRRSRP